MRRINFLKKASVPSKIFKKTRRFSPLFQAGPTSSPEIWTLICAKLHLKIKQLRRKSNCTAQNAVQVGSITFSFQPISSSGIWTLTCGTRILIQTTNSPHVQYQAAKRLVVGSDSVMRLAIKKTEQRCCSVFFIGEVDDWMSELFAIYSISSVVGMFIGLSSKVRITLIWSS